MDLKRINIIWIASLSVISIATSILIGAEIIAFEFHDIIIRVLGVLDLITLPVVAFSTVKKLKIKQ